VRVFPDPDPTWNGSSWINPPPSAPAGSHFMRWTARSLPSPLVGGLDYLLGARSSVDGTSGLPAGCASWGSQGDFAVNLNSDYPFKPLVAPYTHHALDGTTITTSQAVHFTRHSVEHMWADMGTILTPPFTFMIVCVLTRFGSAGDAIHIIDSGQDPTSAITAATRARWYNHGLPGRTNLPGENALTYRTALMARRSHILGFNDPTMGTKVARVPFAASRRPKVIYGIYNGNNSEFGVFGSSVRNPTLHKSRQVKLSGHGAQRFLVLGRANGCIDRDFASGMVVFEIRVWDTALTSDQIIEHYAQLSSTWKLVLHV